MPAEPAPLAEAKRDRVWLAAAAAVTIAWFLVYNTVNREYLCDEGGHLGNVYHFLEGKQGWPEQMTMLPGYHFLVAALWQLHPPCSLLTLARLVTLGFALAALGGLAAAWRRWQPGAPLGAGKMALLFALFPLLQPFNAMAYTDAPALATVLAALLAQWHGRHGLAAAWFAIAAVFRQTNLIWAGGAVVLEAIAVWSAQRTENAFAWREFFRRTRWLLLLLAIAAGVVLAAGRVTVGTATGTEMRPNIATLHCAALLGLVLGLPVWLAALPATARAAGSFARRRRTAAWLAGVGAALAVAVLARTYANPHAWNRDLFWEGESFTLLRNWPLVWIERVPALRVASAINVVAMAAATALVVVRSKHRAALGCVLAIGALPALLNNLVEPRYFIPGAVLGLIFVELTPRAWRALLLWWALLCAAHAPFVALRLSLW